MSDKRFQECNRVVKAWRYRWYLTVPFLWLWHSTVSPFKVYRDEVVDGKYTHTDTYDVARGRNLWHLLMGIAQGNMNWYYTQEEVMEKFKIDFD